MLEVANQSRRDDRAKMSSEKAVRQDEGCRVEDGECLSSDLLADEQNRGARLLDGGWSVLSVRVRAGDEDGEVFLEVVVDRTEGQGVLIDHESKLLGQIAEAERKIDRVNDWLESDGSERIVDTLRRTAAGVRHGEGP